ncbi:MAG: hypothetical protein HKN48_02500, partial [Flavobacteriaceae bacterium]|nr:hypothetical protein [Flavobacteriaceae bacterium]
MRLPLLSLMMMVWLTTHCFAQQPNTVKADSTKTSTKIKKESPFVTGYYPLGFFNVDLRYFIKYNSYEGFRLGFGGITNERLFEKFKIGGYVARGFKDDAFKYSLGGNLRLNQDTNTWLNLYYQNDINEIGTFKYLTDARIYSVFEPRLLNITQFYSYRTWRSAVQHSFSSKAMGELRFSRTKIDQIENYRFVHNGNTFKNYYVSEATFSFRLSPKTTPFFLEDESVGYTDGLPKISAQVTQGFRNIARGDFNYTKFGLKLDHHIKRVDLSSTKFTLEGLIAFG